MNIAPTLVLPLLLAALLGCDTNEEIPLPTTDFSAAEVVSMDVTHAGESATFVRTDERQWFRHSEGHQHTHFSGAQATTHRHVQTDPVDDQLISGAIERLAELKADGIPEDKAVSLNNPSMTIALRGQEEGMPLLTLQLEPTRAATGAYYVKTSTNDQIFIVSRQKIAPVLELLSHTQPAAHQH